jgi:hypothetical protein
MNEELINHLNLIGESLPALKNAVNPFTALLKSKDLTFKPLNSATQSAQLVI